MKSFIINLIEFLIKILGNFSLFTLLRKVFVKKKWPFTYVFIDTWVFLHLVLSLLTLFTYSVIQNDLLKLLLIIYAIIRIIELVVYQMRVLLIDQFKSNDYALRGYRRILVLSLMNYFEILAWFALFYHKWAHWFDDRLQVLHTAIGSLYFSLVSMSTLGYGEVLPLNNYARLLIFFQIIIGIFLLILIISRIISYLPKPKTLDENEKIK